MTKPYLESPCVLRPCRCAAGNRRVVGRMARSRSRHCEADPHCGVVALVPDAAAGLGDVGAALGIGANGAIKRIAARPMKTASFRTYHGEGRISIARGARGVSRG